MTDRTPPQTDSPCVKICVVDPETDMCIGCGRKTSEIVGWLRMNAETRRDVLQALPDRLANLTRRKRRKGGAQARRGERSDGLRPG